MPFLGYFYPSFNTADIVSGSVASGDLGDAVVVSGNIASGQIGFGHLANTSVQSGTVASGTIGRFHHSSGAINSGHIASGAILGQAGGGAFTIASGSIGSFDISIGAVYGASPAYGGSNIASGSIGSNDFSSGSINSGHISSGAVLGQAGGGAFNIASGTVGSFDIGSGAIVSGRIASGQIGTFHIASGGLLSGGFGSGQIGSLHLASGGFGPRAGLGTPTVKVGGTINSQTNSLGNVGIGEDDLHTYNIPASTLANSGDSIYFEAYGTIANNVNAKRLRVKLGATTLFDTGASGIPISAAIDWVLRGRIVRTGAATQKCVVYLNTSNATLASYVDYVAGAEDNTTQLTLKTTAEAVSDNDAVEEVFRVEWSSAP